jgi:N-acetylneuraminic acid mutarotase
MFNAGGEVFAGLGHSGSTVYKDWYKLDTALNTWSAMNVFPGEARVAGTQFNLNGYGYVLSGDGDNHSYMQTGEMWSYNPTADSWLKLTPHPGESRWAPGSFVINNDVYFFGGLNRFTNQYPNDLWKFSLGPTVEIEEKKLTTTSVFPNPANSFVSWENNVNITGVELHNAFGQLIIKGSASAKQINTENLNNGLYFVLFYDKSTLIKTSKVLIQH